jgi:hypothetical protein
MEVPLAARYASSGAVDRTSTPTVTQSGFMRPSAVGPALLKSAAFPSASMAPTVRPFLSEASGMRFENPMEPPSGGWNSSWKTYDPDW